MFVAEISRQYTYWLHFFREERKKQFIPLPWKIRDFIFRNMNRIDEFAGHFHNFNLKYGEKVKGLDPNGTFVKHLLAVGFIDSFIKTILNEDGDNGSGTLARDIDDLETIFNTNELYKQRGKCQGEKSAQSSTVMPKCKASWSSVPTTYPSKKVTHGSSSRGGDKNPPSEIESSHKLPVRKKRKNIVQEEKGPHRESEFHDLFLEDM